MKSIVLSWVLEKASIFLDTREKKREEANDKKEDTLFRYTKGGTEEEL